MVHDKRVYPDISASSTYMQPDQDVTAFLSITTMDSTDDVSSMPQDQRRCWYPNEVTASWKKTKCMW